MTSSVCARKVSLKKIVRRRFVKMNAPIPVFVKKAFATAKMGSQVPIAILSLVLPLALEMDNATKGSVFVTKGSAELIALKEFV